MNATAKQAYSFCGASPSDGEHEVRQRGNNRNKGFEILVKRQSFSNQY